MAPVTFAPAGAITPSAEFLSTVALPSVDLKKSVFNSWRKNVNKYWLTAYRTKPAQEKW